MTASFSLLPEPDQFALLRAFYVKVMALRMAFMVDKEQTGYPMLRDESGKGAVFVSFSNGKLLTKSQGVVQHNLNTVKMVHAELENDLTIRDLV